MLLACFNVCVCSWVRRQCFANTECCTRKRNGAEDVIFNPIAATSWSEKRPSVLIHYSSGCVYCLEASMDELQYTCRSNQITGQPRARRAVTKRCRRSKRVYTRTQQRQPEDAFHSNVTHVCPSPTTAELSGASPPIDSASNSSGLCSVKNAYLPLPVKELVLKSSNVVAGNKEWK